MLFKTTRAIVFAALIAIPAFADGFKGQGGITAPNQAVARPDGVAQAPDGSLYISDSVKRKIWRAVYKGK